jgi:hypothetical protein
MLRMLRAVQSKDPYIRVVAAGRLDAADYRRFNPAFAVQLSLKGAPIALLLDLTEFHGWTLGGFLHDLAFDLRNRRTFSRIAVIGRPPLFAAELRYFWSNEEESAAAWLEA